MRSFPLQSPWLLLSISGVSGTQEGCHMPQRECIASWEECQVAMVLAPGAPHPPRPSLISDLIKDFNLSSLEPKGSCTTQGSPWPSSAQTPAPLLSEKKPKSSTWPRRPYRTRLHPTYWTSPPVTHRLAHSTPALLVSSLYLKYARYAPASGPLHRLSPFVWITIPV